MTPEEKIAQLEEQLDRCRKESQDFAYIVSHDLSTPLRHIDYFSRRFANNTEALNEEGLEDINTVRNATQKAKRLLDSVLYYSRIEREMVEPTLFALDKCIERAQTKFTDKITESAAIIKVDTQALSVFASKANIVSVFGFLLSNGLTYQPENQTPEITISAKLQSVGNNKLVEISVCDNGIGLAEKNFEKVMTIFKRGVTDREYPGDGLGLAYSKKIITLCGGDLWLEKPSGQGLIVKFTLPAQEQ